MWIYTNTGMISAVEHRDDSNLIMVRARTKQHLINFTGIELADAAKIIETPNADYAFRVNLVRETFIECMIDHAEKINYPDFKSSIKDDLLYSIACSHAWQAMNAMGKGKTLHADLTDESSCEWIPCTHDMPDESGMYITYWTDGTIETFHFDLNEPESGWYEKLGGEIITHWADLPAAPKMAGAA